MIKRISILIFSLLFFVGLTACDVVSSGKNSDDLSDYNVARLEVSQDQSVAPCSFFNFIYGNEHARKYFVESLEIPFGQVVWRSVKINGVEWTKYLLEKLPEGRYKIEIVADIPYSEVQKKTFIARLNVSNDNEDITGGIDYLAESITLSERHVGKQALFREFLDSNFHFRAYFWYALNSVQYNHVWQYVLINGEEWTYLDLLMNELPIGEYDIIIKLNENFVIKFVEENGEIVDYYCPRMLTIPVKVEAK